MINLNHVTREELYEAVWAEPVQKLAAKLGISDVGLAKIAHRLNVPLPWNGRAPGATDADDWTKIGNFIGVA